MPSDAILEHHFLNFSWEGIPPDPPSKSMLGAFYFSNSTKLSSTEMFEPYHFKTASYGPVPMSRLSLPQRFFCFRAIQWWNSLPPFVTAHINSSFSMYVDALRQYCDSLH